MTDTIRDAAAIRLRHLSGVLGRHRIVARVGFATLAFALVLPLSHQASTQAGPERAAVVPEPLLPLTVGIGLPTSAPVAITFDAPMDPASVEAALEIFPATDLAPRWSSDGRRLEIRPGGLWASDTTYLVVVGEAAQLADGTPLADRLRFSFTTQTAPAVIDVALTLAGRAAADAAAARSADAIVLDADAGAEAVRDRSIDPSPRVFTVPRDVSATTTITLSFNRPMDRASVEEHFAIAPHVDGALAWSGDDLVFTPTTRFAAGGRYTVHLGGARDRLGNVLGGRQAFSFVTRPASALVSSVPAADEEVERDAPITVSFSHPMDTAAAAAALRVADAGSGQPVDGSVAWDASATQLTFTPSAPLAEGATFQVTFEPSAPDADGNPVEMAWAFSTPAPAPLPAPPAPAPTPAAAAPSAPPAPTPTAPAPAPAPPSPAAGMAGHAVAQINASRAAYGFGPVVHDARIAAVAYAHAYDQAVNGYFSHTGLNGSTRESRLRAGGVSFGWSGENQCYLVGRSVQATLDWCHAQFMAEPYPGHWNHIANVLSPNARRVGVGIAQVGAKIVVVWDFTD